MAYRYAFAALAGAPAVLAAPAYAVATQVQVVTVVETAVATQAAGNYGGAPSGGNYGGAPAGGNYGGAPVVAQSSAAPAEYSAAPAQPSHAHGHAHAHSSQAPAASSQAPAASQPAEYQPASSANQPAGYQPSSAAQASSAAYGAAPSVSSKPSSASGNTGSSGGKKGLAYTKPAFAQATQIAQSDKSISWMMDWEGYPGAVNTNEVNGLEFVPMLQNGQSMFTSAWTSGNPGPQGSGAKNVMFINEPDNINKMGVNDAVSLWHSTYAPHAGNANLGGPSVTSNNAPDSGPDYAKQFKAACQGCNIKFWGWHYYGLDTSMDSFQTALNQMKEAVGGDDIWVTEYSLYTCKMLQDSGKSADTFSQQQRADFIKQATQILENDSQVKRYSPYMVGEDGSDDTMQPGNTIAKAYASAN